MTELIIASLFEFQLDCVIVLKYGLTNIKAV